MAQTAVEWLADKLMSELWTDTECKKYIEQAKQMHERQIVDGYKHGQNNEFSHLMVGKLHITGEEYYEQTYKTQAQ